MIARESQYADVVVDVPHPDTIGAPDGPVTPWGGRAVELA
jgi:hypothetical protein